MGKQLKRWARENRSSPTPSEERVIKALYRLGVPYQSQVPHHRIRRICDVQVDCARLIIEIDGPYHRNPAQSADDVERELQIIRATKGFRVVRFTSDETMRGDFVERLAAVVEDAMNEALARRYPFGRIVGRWKLASQS